MSRIGTGSTTNLTNSKKFSLTAVENKSFADHDSATRPSTEANEEINGSITTSALYGANNQRKLKQSPAIQESSYLAWL